MTLPSSLVVSTVALVVVSVALDRSLRYVRREKQKPLRRSLLVACAFGCLFLGVQGWSLADALGAHWEGVENGFPVYGMIFFLVALHAVHVLAGMLCLGVVTHRAFRHAYDHECYRGLRMCVVYWHFVDAVWLVMLATFLLTA
jgi:heme/copper-type cytochrome/quinol oxidase subunit 3